MNGNEKLLEIFAYLIKSCVLEVELYCIILKPWWDGSFNFGKFELIYTLFKLLAAVPIDLKGTFSSHNYFWKVISFRATWNIYILVSGQSLINAHRITAKWNSLMVLFHCGHFDRNENLFWVIMKTNPKEISAYANIS